MTGLRSLKLLVVCTLLISGVGTAALTVAGAQPYVQISSVSVSPTDPAPGERVTVETTIQNLQSSTETVEISDIYLRKSGSTREYGRIEDVGAVAPGGSVTIPMPVTFDTAGQKRLTVHVVVRTNSGNFQSYEYPAFVTVETPTEALLSFSTPEEAAVGDTTPVTVTVANGYGSAISGVQLTLNGSETVGNPERVTAAIPEGSNHTFQYDVRFEETGTGTLTAELTYKTETGTTRSTTKTVSIPVVDAVVRADLSARRSPNRTDGVEVELTNFGNVHLSDIEVTATDDGDVVARGLLADVAPKSSRTVLLTAGPRVNDNLTFTATYEAAGQTETTTLTTNVAKEVLGEIRLTSVEATRAGTVVTIDGEAANIGSTDVESVLVNIVTTDGVRPVAPSGEYFVGAIDASEFATFELTAEADSGVSSIPVEVVYIVDNERVRTTQQLDISSAAAPPASGGGQSGGADGPGDPSGGETSDSGGLSGIWLVVGLLVVAAIGFGVYRWRQQ